MIEYIHYTKDTWIGGTLTKLYDKQSTEIVDVKKHLDGTYSIIGRDFTIGFNPRYFTVLSGGEKHLVISDVRLKEEVYRIDAV